MNPARPLELDQPGALYEQSALVSLLKQGLEAIAQEHYIEGAAFLSLVRTYLPSEYTHINAALDAFLAGNTDYQQVSQALQEVSGLLAEAHKELRIRASSLTAPLTALINSMSCRILPIPIKQFTPQNLELNQASILSQSSTTDEEWYNAEFAVTCFGQFVVRKRGQSVALCANRKGQAILRYLVVTAGHSATTDKLQALFWPEDEMETAQHKLHIAVSSLRRSLLQGGSPLPENGYIIYKQQTYALNPMLSLHTDVETFWTYYQLGQQQEEKRILYYERACRLYTGPFLVEDLYADWSSLQRERLCRSYLAMCGVLAHHYLQIQRYAEAEFWAIAMLKEDKCDEAAHRLLIQMYTAQGRRHDAMQQYRVCEHILRQELGVRPLPETRSALCHSLPD